MTTHAHFDQSHPTRVGLVGSKPEVPFLVGRNSQSDREKEALVERKEKERGREDGRKLSAQKPLSHVCKPTTPTSNMELTLSDAGSLGGDAGGNERFKGESDSSSVLSGTPAIRALFSETGACTAGSGAQRAPF